MKKTGLLLWKLIQERFIFIYIALAFCGLYFTIGLALPHLIGDSARHIQNQFFGFSQFRFLLSDSSIAVILISFASITFFTYVLGLVPKFSFTRDGTFPLASRIVTSVIAVGVFFILRSNFINPDGVEFTQKFLTDIPLRGFHATHDEMWELYLHSRFWFYTNQYFDWSVELSYQVLSCLAGGVFIFLLLTYCSKLFPDSPFYAFVMCIAGGYMQLFFGDIENYTLTSALLMGYFLVSALFLEKNISIVYPSALLAIAITFHLLSGFLLPSLLFLYIVSWRRDEKHLVLYAIASFCIIIGSTLLFFHLNGLPLSELWYNSHAFGHGGNILSMLVTPSLRYYFSIINLAFLLVPAWVLLFPLVIYKRITKDAMNIHLLIAAGGMAVLVLVWKAGLGVYNDWNLFAPAALPVSFLVWRNVLRIKSLQLKFSPLHFLGWVFLLHSFTWIVVNHFK